MEMTEEEVHENWLSERVWGAVGNLHKSLQEFLVKWSDFAASQALAGKHENPLESLDAIPYPKHRQRTVLIRATGFLHLSFNSVIWPCLGPFGC